MKLTLEDNPETIQRYAHIKQASRFGVAWCGARCPGTRRSCTLEKGHRGHHVAHGRFKKVVAVWDGEAPKQRGGAVTRKAGGVAARKDLQNLEPLAVVKLIADRVRDIVPSFETGVFLVLFLAMVGFVIDWALRMAGLK